ncbi:hypothetical protein HK104_002450, partial [Borealophlyctis nickersoniae]
MATTNGTPNGTAASSKFEITPDEILKLIDPKDPEAYAKLGRAEGLAKLLHTDLHAGLHSGAADGQLAATDGDAEAGASNTALAGGARRKSAASAHQQHNDLFEDRRKHFGTNQLPEPVSKSLIRFMLDAMKDKTLIGLSICAAVEIAIGIYKAAFAPVDQRETLGVIDGVAIIVAVLIVVLVASLNDFRKQAQFRKLTTFSKSLAVTKVYRDGRVQQIQNTNLLVGDLCQLETGDVLPADGVLVQGFSVEADESSMTGEPNAIKKDLEKDPFLLSGTKITNGQGRMLVIAVGCNSMNGRTMLALEVEPEETPLQAKLSNLADQIAKYGLGSAVAMLVILIIVYFAVPSSTPREGFKIANDIIAMFISAVTLVVVAVPEGLPLAVTISLAHATVQMLKDNNLVRHLSACETMGNATTICSDKTGTLTLNKMTVVQGQIAMVKFVREDLPDGFKSKFLGEQSSDRYSHQQKILQLFAQCLNINSSASEVRNRKDEVEFTGSKTEIATLNLTKGLGFPYQADRDTLKVVQVFPFSSERKRMGTVVEVAQDNAFEAALGITESADNNLRHWMFVKGASEIVLKGCISYVAEDGKVKPLTDDIRQKSLETIESYANGGFRTLCISFKPFHPRANPDEKPAEGELPDDAHSLILLATVAIQDPVRPEVPDAVKNCQSAGITVRMVTGDNLATASTIARECGILTDSNQIVMEGPQFRSLTPEMLDQVIPRLRVLARSSPLDKQVLVKALKRLGQTVAATGDGTNDAPALKGADVGFAMGIAGTEVAKEASDIVILDDNFASIVKAVLWGRSVYDSVRKFLQFQLTVNVTAVLLTVVTSVVTTATGDHTPTPVLKAVQLLWVNLIM